MSKKTKEAARPTRRGTRKLQLKRALEAVPEAPEALASPEARRERGAPTIRSETLFITPQMAEKWLENIPPQRAVNDTTVATYGRDMVEGRWMLNGEAIKFTEDGMLLDGQHRLWAIFNTGVTVPSVVQFGVPQEAMMTIDTGRPRSFANVLQIRGQSNALILAAAARWWYAYDGGNIGIYNNLKLSHSELDGVLRRHPDLVEVAREVAGSQVRRVLSAGTMTFVHSATVQVDPAKARQFLEGVARGVGLEDDSPVFRLRDRALALKLSKTAKVDAIEMCALVIKAWNAFYNGLPVQQLRWRSAGVKAEDFPLIAGYEERRRGD
jgi:hypothetical protein